MDEINLKQIITEFPDCVTNGAKLKAILLDTYPEISKAIVNTLVIMANSGVAKEIQDSKNVTELDKSRWQQKLEDEGFSEKVADLCLDLFLLSSNINSKTSYDRTFSEELLSHNSTVLDIPLLYDPNEFEIEFTTLIEYKGMSKTVVVPEGVTEIGSKAFACNKQVKNVVLPSSISMVDAEAFEKSSVQYTLYDNAMYLGNEMNPFLVLVKAINKSIITCKVHENTKVISENAFQGCCKLKEIIIPDGILSIGRAFDKSVKLELNEYGNAYYLGNKHNPFLVLFSAKYTDIVFCDIHSSTKIIASGAFCYCKNLKKVSLPQSIISIGSSAFCCCSSLVSVSIPNSVNAIKRSTFSGCKNLQNIVLSDQVKEIGHYAFNGCASLEKFIIPLNTITIGEYAFAQCKILSEMYIPDCVKHICDFAFSDCTCLKKVQLPSYLHFLGIGVFDKCSSLQYNDYNGALYLGNNSNPFIVLHHISSQNITACKIHNQTKFISDNAFNNCKELKTIQIGQSVKEIGMNAFLHCELIENVVLPDQLEHIGKGAFAFCCNLISVNFGSKLKTIGESAFEECCCLSNVALPYSFCYMKRQAFSGCINISSISFGKTRYIGSNAFRGCKGLTTLTIPQSVVSIGNDAFGYNDYLKKVVLFSTLSSVSRRAFAECKSLRTIEFHGTKEQLKTIIQGAYIDEYLPYGIDYDICHDGDDEYCYDYKTVYQNVDCENGPTKYGYSITILSYRSDDEYDY